jgi:hypothetical protein
VNNNRSFFGKTLILLQEVQDADHEQDVLLNHITGISQDLCGTVLRMEAMNHVDMIGRLKSDIETYTRWGFLAEWSYCTEVDNCIRLLEETSKFLGEYDGLGALRCSARNQLRTGLSDLQQKLNSFGAWFWVSPQTSFFSLCAYSFMLLEQPSGGSCHSAE